MVKELEGEGGTYSREGDTFSEEEEGRASHGEALFVVNRRVMAKGFGEGRRPGR